MRYRNQWAIASSLCTILLGVLAQVQSLIAETIWRLVAGLLAILAVFALWREMRTQRIPKPHPLRVRVQKFICDLSETKGVSDSLISRAKELKRDFGEHGVYCDYTPDFKGEVSHETLDRAAVSFQKMLDYVAY
jgi:hypothetical protein